MAWECLPCRRSAKIKAIRIYGMPKFLLSFVTCKQRHDIFQKTLQSLKAGDWLDEPEINMDVRFHPDPRRSGTLNSLKSHFVSINKDYDYKRQRAVVNQPIGVRYYSECVMPNPDPLGSG